MIWQDVVLMFGSFGFAIALVPTIRAKSKPPISTSLTTSLILTAFCACYYTLGLYLAFMSTSLTALAWFVLVIQKVRSSDGT